MKLFADIEQGSDDWHRVRLGIPTASNFHKIVTPKTCQLSKQAHDYALKLCAERLLNIPTQSLDGLQWLERGKEMEPDAVRQYEFTTERQTVKVGFITNDDGTLGCSPDRLVVDPNRKVGLEIKCPSPHVHLGYLLSLQAGDDYKPQVQGQILVAELDRADFYSFHPRMPPVLIKHGRDKAYLDKLASALLQFTQMLAFTMERAQALGVFQALERATTPLEVYEAQAVGRALDEETFDKFTRHGFNN